MRQILGRLQPKDNYSIVVSSDKTEWTTYFSPPLHLNPEKNFEIALVNLETYYAMPNITNENNMFVYSPDNGTTYKRIDIPVGSYEIAQINSAIQRQLEINKDWSGTAHYITLQPNFSTLCSTINITNQQYKVDMTRSTVRKLLGFEQQVLDHGFHVSENPVDILSISSILINCDIASGSYLNGRAEPIIYSFFPDVSPGYKIIETPHNLVYLPISRSGDINQIRVWLTDQNGVLLDNRGETINIRLHIRQCI